jgi:hypothetical protein
MVSANARYRSRSQYLLPTVSPDFVIGLVTWLLIVLAVAFSIYRQTPPAAVTANTSLLGFSSGRTMKHLEMIAQKPHPMGSLEHAVVRNYILQELEKAGLKPETQETTAINSDEGGHTRAGTVQNLVARLPGTASTKAILLAGHYDSVPNGAGASDDGAAVVTMLETLRALKAGAPLKNDVIFLFTDGEEAGLLGAKAFVAEHPLAKDVGLVLNFEARGNSGPAIMFETSEHNGWLIREFAKAVPYPVAHSLAYEIYRLLPNDTDLTVFKKAHLSGLNFAYINGLTHYHTQLDSLSEINERSLQHEGSTALALTQHFGNLSLEDTKEANAVYFDIVGLTLVHYSGAWAPVLTIITIFVFSAVVVIGLRRGRVTIAGFVLGFLAFLLSLVAAPLFVSLVWWLIQRLQEVPGVRPLGEAYNNNLYLVSFVACTIAVTSALFVIFRRKIAGENLVVGALISWVLLLVLATIFVPGASYLLLWPLLFSLPGLLYMLAPRDHDPNLLKQLLLFSAGSVVGIILWAPTIYQTFIGLTLNSIWVVMTMVVLVFALLIPHLKMIAASNRWLLPGAAALTALVLIVAASLSAGYDAKHPRQDTVLYDLNADTGKAIWASSDKSIDSWTQNFLPANIQRGPLTEVFSLASSRQFLRSPAPAEALSSPNIALLEDRAQDGVRTLHMRVTSRRQAPLMAIFLDSPAEVVGSLVNGKRIVTQNTRDTPVSSGARGQWDLRYYAVPQEGIDLVMEVKSAQPLKLRVVDQTYGLPQTSDKTRETRPPGIISAPLPYNDSTFVTRSFSL